jgi:hypothetical protein
VGAGTGPVGRGPAGPADVVGVRGGQARAAHDGLVARAARMVAEVEPARAGLAAAVQQVAELRGELRRVQDIADTAGYVIDDHGVVSDLSGPDTGSTDDDGRVGFARESEARVDGLV